MSANTTQFFDMGLNVNSLLTGFRGGMFDGRYVYYTPGSNSIIGRYDTTLSFGAPASYSMFDTSVVTSDTAGFGGSAFDGRYIYFANNATRATICRYDTTLPFGASTSYVSFDLLSQINSLASGFGGCLFDGRYVYFVPLTNITASGLFLSYDTTISFTSALSYNIFDLSANVDTRSLGFSGGAFDGRYLYLVPDFTIGSQIQGQITRYDTSLSFNSSTSYSIFDALASINSFIKPYLMEFTFITFPFN